MEKHKKDIQELPFSLRAQECVRTRAGARILVWVLEKKSRDIIVTPPDPRAFFDRLGWFLIGEGLEEYVWRYLKLVEQQGNENRPDTTPLHLLGGLSDAHWRWSRKLSAEPSLLCFKKAIETCPLRSRDRGGSLIGITTSIVRVIEHQECPPYDDGLFACFVDNMYRSILPILLAARMPRPRRPDPRPFLRALRQDPWQYQNIWKAKSAATRAFGTDLMRLSYILHHEGLVDDVVWLDSLVESRIPVVWSKKADIWRGMDNNRKLDFVRQQSKARPTKSTD